MYESYMLSLYVKICVARIYYKNNWIIETGYLVYVFKSGYSKITFP